MIINFQDTIVLKAKFERQSDNVRDVTNATLYTGLAYAIASGMIAPVLVTEMIVIGIVNKSVRYLIKRNKIDDKLYSLIKSKKVGEVNV